MRIIKNRFGTVQYQYTRMGVDMLGRGERNTCTVRTLAKLANVPFEFAHEIAASLGRVSGKGMPFVRITEWDNSFKRIERSELDCGGKRKRVTVGQFVAEHPKGRFAVRVDRHVFALIDGVIYDMLEPVIGQTVKSAWSYE